MSLESGGQERSIFLTVNPQGPSLSMICEDSHLSCDIRSPESGLTGDSDGAGFPELRMMGQGGKSLLLGGDPHRYPDSYGLYQGRLQSKEGGALFPDHGKRPRLLLQDEDGRNLDRR